MEHTPAFTAALILASAHLFGSWSSRSEASKKFWERRSWISAAAGISVAYVFIDLLPELGAQQRIFAESESTAAMLFAEDRIYILALASFIVFYGLDRIVLPKRAGSGGEETAYRIRLAGFTAYTGMIGYLLVERAERGWFALTAYTFAMAVHFLIIGRSLAEEHGLDRQTPSRVLLAASALGGCLLSATIPFSDTAFARLFAILAGGVVITSLGQELPGEHRGRFLPFFLGAAIFTAALLASEVAIK